MAFIDLFNTKQLKELKEQVFSLQNVVKKQANAYYQYPYYYSPIIHSPYTGEKTPGEMGAAKDYNLLYDFLRVRSWQSYLESEITQIIIDKFVKWVIGNGLYIQAQPEKIVLKQEGINSIPEDFAENVNARFNLWISSRHSDSAGMFPINQLAFEAYKNAIVGGDVLVINYPEKGNLTQQIIDGSHVISPLQTSEYWKAAYAAGNRIEYGVEINKNNAHVAYYVRGLNGEFYRIERIGRKSGQLMAYLVYGNRYRIDDVRGVPLIARVLESLKKLDRYKEATVSSAEQAAKIILSVEHGADSTGENPFVEKLVQSGALGMGEAPESKSVDEYEAAATKIATMTNNSTFNLPIGAKLQSFVSEKELYFKDFYTTNFQLVCAAIGMPFEVALSMFNSNYSASRAAIKEWEYSFKTARQTFSERYYQPYYDLWLEIAILNGKINAPGYIKAINDRNIMALEAYRSARWLGANVPHIDPVKEVMAERMKLGDDTTPLTTYDQASETLGSGDFKQVVEKVKTEKDIVKKELGELTPKPEKTIKQELLQNIIFENETIK
jgi:capsid protein